MTTFLVSYSVNPPQTVVHRENCPESEPSDYTQRVDAESAAAAHASLSADYRSRLATEVDILICACTGAAASKPKA